jgi:LSD1 subclass zinc finger protein
MVCSSCRKPLPYGAMHWVCSVSTCNRQRTKLVFCSVGCWDAHLGEARHREAWAVEERAPEQGTLAPAAPTSTPPPAGAPRMAAADESESDILIVVSKVKKYIRERSGMNTSDSVAEILSEHVRAVCDVAIRTAGAAGRKTVLDRDVPPVPRKG